MTSCYFIIGFLEGLWKSLWKSSLLIYVASPSLIDSFPQLPASKVLFVHVFGVEIKVLDTEIFPQYTITNLNSVITSYFIQSGEAFTMKGNK